MAFTSYKRLFIGLIFAGCVTLIATALVAKFAPSVTLEEKRWLATGGLVLFGVAFVVNAACGVVHKRLFARGGLLLREQDGKMMFSVMVVLNAILAGIVAFAAAKTWSGALPVFE